MYKNWTFIAAAACIILLTSACMPPGASSSASTQQTRMVVRGTISHTIEASGVIAANSEAKLSFQQSGVVRTVNVSIGDAVKKGDALAELDTTDLELNAQHNEALLEQSKNSVRNAEEAIIVAQANYSRTVQGTRQTDIKAAQASLVSAMDNYTKTTSGQSYDAVAAKAAVDAAQANFDKVKAGPTPEDIAGVRASLQNADAALKAAQSAYDSAYKFNPAAIGASSAALALEQATNNYNLAKSNYDKAAKGADNAQLSDAEQQLASANAAYARYYGSSYAANASAAQQQIASAQATLDKLKEPARDYDVLQLSAQIEQARIALENAKVTVKLNEIAVAQARRSLEQAGLRAPFDGTIGSVNVQENESVINAGAPTVVFVIVDTGSYHMDATVDELDVTDLHGGQAVNVMVDALPTAKITGRIERISSTSSKINGVQYFSVRIALDNGGDVLKNGMSATANVVLEQKDNALLVPLTAVRRDGTTGKSFVTVQNNNQTQEMEVITGLHDASNIEIISGISDGATIVFK